MSSQDRIDEVMDLLFFIMKGQIDQETAKNLAESLYLEHMDVLVGNRDEDELPELEDLTSKYL